MKSLALGFISLLIIIPAAAWLYFAVAVRVTLKPVGSVEAAVPLALAGIEMDIPASWRVASYRTDIIFDEKSDWFTSDRRATINELDLDGSFDQSGYFRPELFPEFQGRSLSDEEQARLTAPEGLGRPFEGLVLVNKFNRQIKYVSAMAMDGFLLHLTIDLAWPEGKAALSREEHNQLFADELGRIFKIYEARPELVEAADMRTRFGRVKQDPADHFIRQTVSIRSPEEDFNFVGLIWAKGDCGPDGKYEVCAGLNQFFESHREFGSANEIMTSLVSGYYSEVLEIGEREISGLAAHVSASIRYNIMPWGFDGDWDSLVTSLRIFAGPLNNAGEVMIDVSSEDMQGQGRLDEHFSRHYGAIKDIWSSVRPL